MSDKLLSDLTLVLSVFVHKVRNIFRKANKNIQSALIFNSKRDLISLKIILDLALSQKQALDLKGARHEQY